MLSTGLQWADFSTSGGISSLLGKMSWLVEVHVAQRFEEKGKKSRKGGVWWVRRGESTTVDLDSFSLSHADTLYQYPIKCTLIQDVFLSRLYNTTPLWYSCVPCLIMNAEGNMCSPLTRFCLTASRATFRNIYTHQSFSWIKHFRVILLRTENQAQAHV